MTYRRSSVETQGMSPQSKHRLGFDYSTMELVLINFQAWNVTGTTFIQANAVYQDDKGEVRHRNIGAVSCARDYLTEVPLNRIVYELGKQIELGWRELSSPKE